MTLNRRMPDRDALRPAWADLLRRAGATAGPAELAAAGDDLLHRWVEPHRRYHDLEHLTEVLAALDLLLARHPVADAAPVRLAAWFHDAVYRGEPGLDEERSAGLAEQVLTGLGLPDARIAEVGRLVRMTAQHAPAAGDLPAELLSDADLAILGSAPERYRRYVEAVTAEYRHLPPEVFRAGRAAVLAAIADRHPLFRTAAAAEHWERPARVNLATELADLADLPDLEGPATGQR